MRKGVPVTSESASDVRKIWPPPSPVDPSIVSIGVPSEERGALETPVRLAPAFRVHDVGEGAATDGAELPLRVADGKDGVGVHAGRQPEGGLRLLFVEQVPRGERGAE